MLLTLFSTTAFSGIRADVRGVWDARGIDFGSAGSGCADRHFAQSNLMAEGQSRSKAQSNGGALGGGTEDAESVERSESREGAMETANELDGVHQVPAGANWNSSLSLETGV
jgi:hypothetical protein